MKFYTFQDRVINLLLDSGFSISIESLPDSTKPHWVWLVTRGDAEWHAIIQNTDFDHNITPDGVRIIASPHHYNGHYYVDDVKILLDTRLTASGFTTDREVVDKIIWHYNKTMG